MIGLAPRGDSLPRPGLGAGGARRARTLPTRGGKAGGRSGKLSSETQSGGPTRPDRGRADLHIHSKHSDGTRRPAEIVEVALRAGLRAISLTDHDSVGGVDEITELGREAGLEVVPGIELSTNHQGGDFHVLGYFVNHRDPQLLNALRFLKEERERRAERIVARLNELGVPVGIEDVRRFRTGGTLGRPHVARALEHLGVVSCVEEAFSRYLRSGAPAFVEKYRFSTLEGFALLRSAGAAVVLAHPGNVDRPDLVLPLLEAGVDGVEVWHPRNQPQTQKLCLEAAARHGLVPTGGSDSHGNPAREREAEIGGVSVPYETVERLRAVAARRR